MEKSTINIKFIQKGIAIIVAILLYFLQERLGVTIIGFIIADYLMSQHFASKNDQVIYTMMGTGLLFVGHKISLQLAKWACGPLGIHAFSFSGGFYLGIVEFGSYLLLAVIPLKWVVSKNFKLAFTISPVALIIWLLIAALIEGTYLAGLHNFYI